MAGDNASLSGPDLSETGYASADLAEGGIALGHVGGEAVVLVRHGQEVFAVGATCTHYGGPLSEGLVVGETIRCPWHHACFSLRTGAALRAPALNPIPRWGVERRGDRLFVTAKVGERDPLAALGPTIATRSPPPTSVVIIGAGAAGCAAAEMLRRQGYAGPVMTIDREPDSPYDRPNLSKDYLAGTAQEEWIPLRPPDFYAAHRIEVIRARVMSIEPTQSRVTLADSRTLPYGALLLATGAEAIHLDVPGHKRPFVHTLRSLGDSKAIIAAARAGGRAVVIGASFIGLEVAASLRHRGMEVHVVAPESAPLERVLGPELGRFIRTLHESKGVTFHLSTKPARIEEHAVVLDNGTQLEADLVVLGVGVRPRLELALQAKLAVDRGVAVNEYLETSAPHVFAAGDIARWPDPHTGIRIRVEHWVVAQRQGQTAARNMLGARERFDTVPFFWSQHYDVAVRYCGHAEQWDRIDVTGELTQGRASVAYRAGVKTLAVASVGADHANLEAEAALERNDHAALRALVPAPAASG